jgi:glycerophosphoryl diester phosphodiesterase
VTITTRAHAGPHHPYLDAPGGFVALAHRGFSVEGLENSLAAFGAAVELGFRYVETDAHSTSDGVAVALHDATLDRTTDGSGAIAALPWRRVRRARIGGVEPVPPLEDVLGTWPDLRVNVDVKAGAAVEPVAEAIERTRAHDRVCVTSFSVRRRRATLARLSRRVATSAGRPEVVAAVLGARSGRWRTGAVRAALRGVDCVQVPERSGGVRVVDARFVASAHAAGRQVHVWTVNEAADMERLLDLEVDGLVTDRADVLREVLARRGLWPAASA